MKVVNVDDIYAQYSFHVFFPLVLTEPSRARPASVIRYFCKRLVGLFGLVISIRPLASAGSRKALRKCRRFVNPTRLARLGGSWLSSSPAGV